MVASDELNRDAVTNFEATNRAGKRAKRVQATFDTKPGRRSQVECENEMLKRLLADLVLEKALLTERLREFQTQE